MSKTISIVIPDKLETYLQKAADELGISRSRYISNLLLAWKEQKDKTHRHANICSRNYGGNLCNLYDDLKCNHLTDMQWCPDFVRKEGY